MRSLHDSRLSVVLDLRDPFSYLALSPTIDLARETGIDIEWLPIRAHTLVAPSTPSPEDDRGIRHRRARAQMIAREIAIYSAAQGLEIESPYRKGTNDAVQMAWLWVQHADASRLPEFLSEVFLEFWAKDLDPESADAVAQLLQRLGFDLVAFRQWADMQGSDVLRSMAWRLAEAGVFQSPAYLLDSEIFYGRQHLPIIRWILGGRTGDGPI